MEEIMWVEETNATFIDKIVPNNMRVSPSDRIMSFPHAVSIRCNVNMLAIHDNIVSE